MPYDLTGRSLTPLSELITAAEFPLADYLPVSKIEQIFAGLYYTEAYTSVNGENLVLDLQLAWEDSLEFTPPGCEAFSLLIASAGTRWTTVAASIVVGPDFSIRFEGVTAGLRFGEHVLRDVATDAPAEIEITGDITVSPDGIVLENGSGASLAPAYVGGTKIIVEAADVRPVFGPIDPPGWLGEAPDFQGITFEKLKVTLPPEYLKTEQGADLDIEMTQSAIGTTGFTGRVAVTSTDLDRPVTGQLFGFDFRFRSFTLEMFENGLVEASLDVDMHLDAFDTAATQKWVAVDVAFNANGDFTAALAAEQPPEANSVPGALVTMEYAGAAKFLIRGARLSQESTLWSIYLTGALEMLIDGAANWPELTFDEIGLRSDGQILLPEGGGITFTSPLVAEWHFARLVVPKFRFGRPEGESDKLQIALSAEITLVEGLPAGASVEGLTVTWAPRSAAIPDVTLSGIGVQFGEPGTFRTDIQLTYTEAAGVVEFRGRGALELNALDMSVEIGVIVGYNQTDAFSFLYLFADAKLLPTGIPIAQTGLSIYGFQGLVAYNMALDIKSSDPVDERYYSLFARNPVGITHMNKWVMSKGNNAIGVGIVLGTADKGFAFNVKGMLVIAFPDLTLLLQCKANFLKLKPDLSNASQGTLDALLVYQAGEGALTFDVVAHWGMPGLVEVSGSARAYFNFTNTNAWYLLIGQDQEGKRVTARALKWGDKWLFLAGFWFRLDRTGVVTGILIEVSLKAEAGGFWVEAWGRARGEMALFWEPPQWEGSLELSGRISAGYRGLSIGISLAGRAEARVRRPTAVHIRVEACFKALFWSVCKSHTFKWERPDPPQLEPPIRPWNARPDLWTPIAGTTRGTAQLEMGTMPLIAGQVPTIAPHSVLSLDFAKPMVDRTSRFNEAVSLRNDGYQTIGGRSNYAAAYRLDGIVLLRDPDGVREEVMLWGVWAQETLHPNTTLRLMSSTRFGHDGSLSESFVDGVDIDYCTPPENKVVCVPLSDVMPGYGWLSDGSVYHWSTEGRDGQSDDVSRDEPSDGTFGDEHGGTVRTAPVLWPGDHLSITPVVPWDNVTVRTGEHDRQREISPARGPDGEIILHHDHTQDDPLDEVCYQPGHGPTEFALDTRRGKVMTIQEEWTVSVDARILPPNQAFELRIEYTVLLKAPNGSITEPLGTRIPETRRFRTSGPPAYPGALTNYIAGQYPSAGQRPIYTGYDLAVRFHENYVPYLYASVGQQLGIRLFDAAGNPVQNTSGDPVLIPVTRTGPVEQKRSETVWEASFLRDKDRGCVIDAYPGPPQTTENTLAVLATDQLARNVQYSAFLVSDADPNTALAVWTFTTSAYTTFTELVSVDRRVTRSQIAINTPTATAFDGLARQLGIPTIGYVNQFTITPYVTPDRSRCVALLVESPEPLEFALRLAAEVEGAATTVITNVDETRGIIRPAGGGDWPTTPLTVVLEWLRDPGGSSEQRRMVNGDSTPERVSFTVDTGGS